MTAFEIDGIVPIPTRFTGDAKRHWKAFADCGIRD
jgi:hypothetical protein